MRMKAKMVLGQKRHAIGRFSNRLDAEHALNELHSAGFTVAQISIVAKYTDYEHQRDDGTCINEHVGNEAHAGAITGGMLGAVLGCLVGLGMLVVPGVGLIVAVGTSGTAVGMTLAGAGIGVTGGGLISTLASLKIFSNTARVNIAPCLRGEYLLMVDGTNDEVHRAEFILSKSCSSKVWIC